MVQRLVFAWRAQAAWTFTASGHAPAQWTNVQYRSFSGRLLSDVASVRDVGECAAMPEKAALIAVLITDRPLCLDCISERSELTPAEVKEYLRRVEHVITWRRGIDRCRTCENVTKVFSMVRPD